LNDKQMCSSTSAVPIRTNDATSDVSAPIGVNAPVGHACVHAMHRMQFLLRGSMYGEPH